MSRRITFYHSPNTRSSGTLTLLHELGAEFDLADVNMAAGDQRKAAYLAVNPMGKVPALKDGDVSIAEASAIAAYVAERYPDAKLAPPLGDPRRGKYLQWLFFAPSCIEPALIQIFTKIEVPASTAAWGSSTQVFDVLDAALEKGPFLLGDTFSAADIMVGSGLNFAIRLFKMVPARPSFDRYIDACSARPAFQRATVIAAG